MIKQSHDVKEAAVSPLKKKLHVAPNGDVWEVRREGRPRPRTTHATYEAARFAGLTLARFERGVVTIHRANGQFAEYVSFRDLRPKVVSFVQSEPRWSPLQGVWQRADARRLAYPHQAAERRLAG